jgi:uncharacterized protein
VRSYLPCDNNGVAATIGIISDTHTLIRPAALSALANVSLIIHAGDVGKPEVIDALNTLAPVLAIKGNVDRGSWAGGLPITRTVRVEETRIYVLHSRADLKFNAAARGYGAVISGHSHKPGSEFRDGVLYLNPGSAGPQRFRLPVTIARLHVDGHRLQPEIITIGP